MIFFTQISYRVRRMKSCTLWHGAHRRTFIFLHLSLTFNARSMQIFWQCWCGSSMPSVSFDYIDLWMMFYCTMCVSSSTTFVLLCNWRQFILSLSALCFIKSIKYSCDYTLCLINVPYYCWVTVKKSTDLIIFGTQHPEETWYRENINVPTSYKNC